MTFLSSESLPLLLDMPGGFKSSLKPWVFFWLPQTKSYTQHFHCSWDLWLGMLPTCSFWQTHVLPVVLKPVPSSEKPIAVRCCVRVDLMPSLQRISVEADKIWIGSSCIVSKPFQRHSVQEFCTVVSANKVSGFLQFRVTFMNWNKEEDFYGLILQAWPLYGSFVWS